jgi:MoaA/NifB/PqqE/SkfB family radical SAM enzyme
MISIDGVGDKHDRQRGRRHTWDRVTDTLKALTARRDRLNLTIDVNQVIVDAESIEHYQRLKAFLNPYGVQQLAVLAYEMSATYSPEREIDLAPTDKGEFVPYGSFDFDQLKRFVDDAEEDMNSLPMSTRLGKQYYLRGLRDRLCGHNRPRNPKCVALSSHMRLFPDGSLPTCQFNTTQIGSLRARPFRSLWYGNAARIQREWVNNCPGCWAECEVVPNAIYSGALLWERLSHWRRNGKSGR